MPNPPSLPAEITIYTIVTVHQELLKWIGKVSRPRRAATETSKPWLVDASKVGEVDASGMQLLLALSRSLQTKHRSLLLINPSTRITEACHALGVATLLASDDAAGVQQ